MMNIDKKTRQDWTCNLCHKRVSKNINSQPSPNGCPKSKDKKHLWSRIGARY